jgi:CheY-like chemotaxis protein
MRTTGRETSTTEHPMATASTWATTPRRMVVAASVAIVMLELGDLWWALDNVGSRAWDVAALVVAAIAGLTAWRPRLGGAPARAPDGAPEPASKRAHTLADAAPRPPRMDLASEHPLEILLTDDDAINVKVLTMMLERLGYRADAVENGRQSLAALARKPYDVILMDVQMPELDGLEATRRIRAANGHQPWIIAITSGDSEGDRRACIAAGMNDYLGKPARRDALIEVLRRVEPRASGSVAEPSAPEGDTGGHPPVA